MIFLRKSLDKRNGCVVTLRVRIYTKIYDVMGKVVKKNKHSIETNNNKPTFVVSDKDFRINDDYVVLLANIKQRFRNSQIKAAVRVNDTMIEFYWSVGADIVEMQRIHKWGSGVIKQLSLDLRSAFPNKDGFSVRNLEYMKRWYLFYSEYLTKTNQVGAIFSLPDEFALIPWRQYSYRSCGISVTRNNR